MNAHAQPFTIPVGALSLDVPPHAKVPDLLWGNLAFAAVLERGGYHGVARQQLEQLAVWLRQAPASGDGISAWYAIRTATRQERRAIEGLAEQGFSTFLPCETRIRQSSRSRDVVNAPLFPGYLFVLCSPQDFRRILETDGVSQFVMLIRANGTSEPAAFPSQAILGLQIDERAGLFDRTRKQKVAYRPRKGEKVKITAGVWMGYVAKVLSTPRGERAHVMIDGPFGRGETVSVGHLTAA